MSKTKIYIFPTIQPGETKKNPYIVCLLSGVKEYYSVVNFTKKARQGVWDILVHLDADVFIINWPENLAFRKFGFLQVIFYALSLLIIRVSGKRIIWILHNKKAHNSVSAVSDFTVWVTAALANNVITHSREGLGYYYEKYHKRNISHFPHPVYPALNFPSLPGEPVYDFVIWGSIERYKNIPDFLQFIKGSPLSAQYRFLICGYCKDKRYADDIAGLIKNMPNVAFINKFITEEELLGYIGASRAILYTYNKSSLLSSGALIFSLASKKVIIGPKAGNFNDLADEGMVATYVSFDEIFGLLNTFKPNIAAIEGYELKYTWDNFARFISALETGVKI